MDRAGDLFVCDIGPVRGDGGCTRLSGDTAATTTDSEEASTLTLPTSTAPKVIASTTAVTVVTSTTASTKTPETSSHESSSSSIPDTPGPSVAVADTRKNFAPIIAGALGGFSLIVASMISVVCFFKKKASRQLKDQAGEDSNLTPYVTIGPGSTPGPETGQELSEDRNLLNEEVVEEVAEKHGEGAEGIERITEDITSDRPPDEDQQVTSQDRSELQELREEVDRLRRLFTTHAPPSYLQEVSDNASQTQSLPAYEAP